MRKLFNVSLTLAIISWALFIIFSFNNTIAWEHDGPFPSTDPSLDLQEPTDWKHLAAITGIITSSTAFLAKAFEIIKFFIKEKSKKKKPKGKDKDN